MKVKWPAQLQTFLVQSSGNTMDPDAVRKYRCSQCGHIGWTTLIRGCKECESSTIERFAELGDYKIYDRHRKVVDSLSADLANLKKKERSNTIAKIAVKYATQLSNSTDNIQPGSQPYGTFYDGLVSLLNEWQEGTIDSNQSLSGFVSLWQAAQEYDARISTVIHSEIAKWLNTLSLTPNHELGNSLKTIVSSGSLVAEFLSPDPAAQALAKQALTLKDFGFTEHNLIQFIPEIKGTIVGKFAPHPPGVSGVSVPFNYHINLSEVSLKLIQSSVKMIPLIIALARLELPQLGEAMAIAETIRSIIPSINKLREEQGELCVYRSMVAIKKETKKPPTLKQIEDKLRSPDCFSPKCKFFNSQESRCTIEDKDVETIASFLKDKKVVKKVSADEWWVCL
jgi:hypothetical protein